MARGSSNLIQFGKIVVSGEEKIDDLKKVLYDILETQGYPEPKIKEVTVEDGIELPGDLIEDVEADDAADTDSTDEEDDEGGVTARVEEVKKEEEDATQDEESEPDPVKSVLSWAASKGGKPPSIPPWLKNGGTK